MCRCGHAIHTHRPTANAIYKKRRRGDTRPPRKSCHALVRVTLTKPHEIAYANLVGIATTRLMECKCRDWHPKEVTK